MATGTRNIEHRRKLRALEAKRDSLLQKVSTGKIDLKKVRTEIAANHKRSR